MTGLVPLVGNNNSKSVVVDTLVFRDVDIDIGHTDGNLLLGDNRLVSILFGVDQLTGFNRPSPTNHHYPCLHASKYPSFVKQKGHVRWYVDSPTMSPTFDDLLLSETL